jgi:putative SOS response-associated peptidase YedK
MCGKFTAMASWREVHDFSQPLVARDGEGANDDVVTYGVARPLPVIVLDRETGARRIVPMQWGFPHHTNPRRPQPIHARSETIDTTQAFAEAFRDGQRGIVVFRTFNEGKELTPTKTEQWTIDPQDGIPRGFAFLWRRFEPEGWPAPILACVMATVPASKLVSAITDRMPAILDDADWGKWLGQEAATPAEVKATLKTVEGVNWKMAPEPKKPKPPKS